MHTLEGRKVGILIADGSPKSAIDKVRKAVVAAGATAMLIAPQRIGVATTPKPVDADGQLAGTPSVMVDAIAVVLSEDGAATLCADSAAVQFVADAFAHLKAIGHTPGAAALLERAGVTADAGVTDLGDDFIHAAARRFYDREPSVRTLA